MSSHAKEPNFLTNNIKIYLDMPTVVPEYVCVKITDIPEEFILEYWLAGTEDHNGWIYFEIRHGYYGSPQAGILANNLLCGRLEKEGSNKATTTPGLGNTNCGQYSCASLSMILAFNTWASSTSTILSWSCKGTTKSKPIWQATRLRAWMSNRIFQATEYALTWDLMSKTYFSA